MGEKCLECCFRGDSFNLLCKNVDKRVTAVARVLHQPMKLLAAQIPRGEPLKIENIPLTGLV